MPDTVDPVAQTAEPQSKATVVDESQASDVSEAAGRLDCRTWWHGRRSGSDANFEDNGLRANKDRQFHGALHRCRVGLFDINRCDSPTRAEVRACANQNVIESCACHA